MTPLLSRIAALFTRTRLDAQLDDEVQFHIDMLTQDHMRRGMTERDARAAALRHFGGVTQMKETYRDERGLPLLETFLQDARYSVRSFLRTPGFTVAALLTLALGIGANAAIFSVVNAVLLRPLPYSEPERIVQMYRSSGGLWAGHDARRFAFFKEHMQAFEAFAAWRRTAFNLVAGDTAEYVEALAVSHEYFDVFGGQPLYGRTFAAEEDLPNGPDVAILTHSLWRRMFGSNPSAVGGTVTLGERTYQVVGVMPEGFDSLRRSGIYVPLQPGPRGPGSGFNYDIAARLKPGLTIDRANAEADAAFAAFKASAPATAKFGNETAPRFLSYQEGLARPVRQALLMMAAAVGLLLLIACANTASLLLARATGRGREISVRAALGAARGRIIRQLVTEAVLLFMVGGLLGVALAYWTVPALLAMTPEGYLPAQQVGIDSRVLLGTMALSLVTGIIFGLAPALSLSRHDLVEAFKDDGTRTTASRRSRWMRQGLVVAEVALCLLMLVGAGLLIQTFIALRAVDPGFDPTGVLTARMSLQGERFRSSAEVNRLYDRGLERIRRIPGVQSASVVNAIPMEFGLNLNFDFVDTAEVEFELMDWRYASPEYFETMGIPLVAGRALQPGDRAGSPRVTVISAEFVRRYFKDTNPLGRRITVFKQDGPIEIVGVVQDLREGGLTGEVPPVMYVPVAQASDAAIRTSHTFFQSHWVVRASAITPALTRQIREELRALDPKQPVTSIRSMSEVKSRAMAAETFQATLLAAFALIGLLLAAAGIYGLISYSVAQRTREFGIRLALGATRGRILTAVLRQGAWLAALGILVGTASAIALARTLQSFIVDVGAIDAVTVAAVSGLLLLVALAASLVPALRAVRLNPVSALRE